MKSKRILSLVLAFAMILGTFSFAAAVPNDVVGTEYEDAVSRLELLGILEGYPDGTFRPDNQITRAEFAAVVVRAKGLDGVAKAAVGLPTVFTDVPAAHWASGYVGTAAKLGIVNGIGNNKFAPEAPVKYEEAVTMVMRALGYEPAAKAKGGYPIGYLITASEAGLLAKVKGTQGLPAVRGTVAQIADNALEIPMMVQAGYGDQAMYVVSGTANTDLRTLLDEMGFDSKVGIVTKVDERRNRITVGEGKEAEILKVDEDFDFNYVEQLEIKAWHKGDSLIVYKVLEDAIYGAADGGSKIEVDGTKYAVARGAYLELDGDDEVEADKFDADYAKVLLDEDGDIRWARGYTLGEFIVVAEVDGNEVFDYNEVDLNLKDYTVLKDARTISAEDIEEGDILLFNRAEKFAIVYNDSKVGKIDRVYAPVEGVYSFRLDGTRYVVAEGGLYLDGKVLDNLDDEILDAMMDEEEDVEVFFNTQGEAVLVVGDVGTPVTSSFYARVLASNVYDGRRGTDTLFLEVRNDEGKKVEYDIPETKDKIGNVDKVENFAGLVVNDVIGDDDKLDADIKILKITVDEDGDPTKIVVIDPVEVKEDGKDVTTFDLKKSYAGGYKLQDSTVIFYGTKAVKLGDADFTKVEKATLYVDNNRVVAIIGEAEDTDVDKVTDLVTRVRKLKSGVHEITLINGDVYTTVNDKVEVTVSAKSIATLEVVKKSGLVRKVTLVEPDKENLVVDGRTVRSITVGEDEYELVSGAKLYDITGTAKVIRPLDLAKGDTIDVYYDEGAKDTFVRFVVRVDDGGEVTPPEVTGVVTYIDDPDNAGQIMNVILVDDEAYELTNTTILYNASGDRVAVGVAAILDPTNGGTGAALSENDEVKDVVLNKDGTVKSLVGTKLAVQDAAIGAVWTAAKAGSLATTDFDEVAGLEYVAGNLAAYETAIAAKAKADVNTLAKLQAVIDKVDGDELADAKADVIADKADVNVTAAAGETLTTIKTNVTLVAPATKGSTVTWATSDATVVTNAGAVTRPDYGDGNASVKLTATITKGGYSETKEFNLVVLEKDPTAAELRFEAINEATTVAEMKVAIEAAIAGGELTDNDVTTKYSEQLPANQRLIIEDVLAARPAAGFANIGAVQTAFNTALGL